MATIFVSAVDGNNADSGADWTNAKQTVAGALAIAASGDVIKVDNAGTFTATAAITWTFPSGNVAIISVNRSGSDAWAAGAIEDVGAASQAFLLAANVAGSSLFVYGMTLKAGSNNSLSCDFNVKSSANPMKAVFQSCTFTLPSVSTSAFFNIGLAGAASGGDKCVEAEFYSCTVNAPNRSTGAVFVVQECKVLFDALTMGYSGASKPASLFQINANSGQPVEILVQNSDISGFNAASSVLVDVGNLNVGLIAFKNCKLSANVSAKTGTFPYGYGALSIINCDSGDTINAFEYYNRCGSLTESASIYADTGAQFNGSGVSWQVVTTSVCDEYNPFILPGLHIWNTDISTPNFTVETTRDSATELTDRDIWMDVSYAASASFPTGGRATTHNANPYTGTGANLSTSSETWTGDGGFSNQKRRYMQAASVAAAEVGLIEAVIRVGKASTTIYVDPLIRIT